MAGDLVERLLLDVQVPGDGDDQVAAVGAAEFLQLAAEVVGVDREYLRQS